MNIRRLTGTGEWTTRRYLSLLGNILIWVIVAIDAFYLWPSQLGGSTSMVIVSGHSMEPTYFSGDLVIARKLEPSVGDVIVYAPDGFGGSQIVHRIIGGNATDGWQMQGDNNDFIDPFDPKASEVKGVVLVHYSNFGRVAVLLLNPMVWAFVLIAAIVLLVWWSGDTCEDDPDDDDTNDSAAGGDPDPDEALITDGPTTSESPPEDDTVGARRAAVYAQIGLAAAAVVGAVRAIPMPSVKSVRAIPMPPVKSVRVIAVAVVGLLTWASTVSPASASQLQVNANNNVVILKYAACATQTLTATVSGTATGTGANAAYTEISVSGIAAACRGISTTITLYNAAGGVVVTGTATPTATTATFATGTYVAANVKHVMVTVNGWLFLPSWTAPVSSVTVGTCQVINPGNGNVTTGKGSCTVTVQPNGAQPWTYSGGTKLWNYTFAVTWTEAPPNDNWRWLVTFDQSQSPFPGFTPTWVGGTTAGFDLWTQGSCGALPVIKLEGESNVAGGTVQIANGSAPTGFSGTSICPRP